MESSLLDRMAMLMSKKEGERKETLDELYKALDLSNPQTSKTRSRTVLDNKAVIGVLFNFSSTTCSANVVANALCVFQRLAKDGDNAKRLFQEHPSLVPVAMRKLEFGAENATEGVQIYALVLLQNLAVNVDNKREMVTKYPTLPLLVAKVESNSEQVQFLALFVLQTLAIDVGNARKMVTQNPTLVRLLVAKVESNSEQVKITALGVLSILTINVDNAAEMMATSSALLLPLLVAKMNGSTRSQAAIVLYNLSCSPANRTILRGNNSVVAALAKGREDEDRDTRLFSLLALINLFGTEEDSEVLETDLAMLQWIFGLVAHAKDGWELNTPLLAFRYLCVVEHNRKLLWGEYGSEFLTSVIAALQQAIEDKDTAAAENAMSTLAQFSNDAESLAWMRSNKPRLDKVIAQLAPFHDALKTAQLLQLTLDQEVAATVAPPVAAVPKQPAPQGEKEIRQWLSKHKRGEEIANRLVKEDLVEAEDLENLSNLTPAELKMLIGFDAKQALALGAALKEFF
ncbi:hypothetical protein BASA81_010536 [Batrachochytrium salamandrivorans]|nr:hypothetical protein BASA81_010536 [Batrachochytrium salamandrivorans]